MKPTNLLVGVTLLTVVACAPPTPPIVHASPESAPTSSDLDWSLPVEQADLDGALSQATRFPANTSPTATAKRPPSTWRGSAR